MRTRAALAGVIFLAAVMVAGVAGAQSARGPETVSRLIVKFRDGGPHVALATSTRIARFAADAADAGVALAHRRAMALGAHVLALDHPLPLAQADALAARLAQHPDVESVQPDRRRWAQRVPNDELIGFQTYLDNTVGGIGAFSAWDLTTGSANVVVAVVDTGYRPHAELAGRLLPGYDFISDAKFANDGGGRDGDASDPGDWIDATDLGDPNFADLGCEVQRSSWHGTSVAGVVGADTDNGQLLAGINWAAKILPVRVLGKCGGYDSDIIDGVVWAGGLPVPGVPANPNPAQIINISLGGEGACLAVYHSAFSAVLAHGVTRAIVTAAGNEADDVVNHAPANCSEVIAVASTTTPGSLASYSNFGSGITLSAPGGDFSSGSDGIFVLSNYGTTVPTADAVMNEGGTSFAAPMVAGVVSLMLAVAPNLTAAQVRTLLRSTAKPFPAGSTCDTSRCGTGIVNAVGAVLAAQSLAGGAIPNYQGLWWAAGGAESGWGINFAHSGDQVFATWYTYDTGGRAWWLSMLASGTGNIYAGAIYATTGPPFNAVLFVPGTAPGSQVGTGTLMFSNANAGSFDYTVNGIHQAKAISRYDLFTGAQPTCTFSATTPNFAAATNYQDLWWADDGAESGWGVNFAHQGNSIFATWYTYDLDGAPLWLSVLAPRVGTSNVYMGPLYRTSGPRFDAFDTTKVAQVQVGTATLTFADGNHATFGYTTNGTGGLPAVTQSKQITRFPFAAAGGTRCQ